MNTYKIADLLCNFECSGRTAKQALPYIQSFTPTPDVTLSVTEKSVSRFKDAHPDALISDWEYFLLNLQFSASLLKYNGLVLHSSAVALNGGAYLFSANSGVGKSTHTSLWCRCFKDAFIINDDKPALRCIDGTFYCYGTPWSGSVNLNRNVKLPLKGICFIERDEKNSIEGITDSAVIFEKLLNQTLRRAGTNSTALMLETVDKLIKKVPFYRLKCLPDEESALLSKSVMEK